MTMSTELHKTTITGTDDQRRAATGSTKGIPMRKTLTKLTAVAIMAVAPLGLSSAAANAAPTTAASTQTGSVESAALPIENAMTANSSPTAASQIAAAGWEHYMSF